MIRWTRRLFRAFLIIIALGVLYVAVTAWQVRSASMTDDWADSSQKAQAIVVLGAAQYNGKPSQVLAARLDHAHSLYDQGVAPVIVVTGYKRDSDRFTEAYVGLKYLLNRGVPESDVIVVDDGSNTWESLRAVSRVLAERQISDVMMVSSRYHNRRLEGIAGELGLNAYVSSVGPYATGNRLMGETARVSLAQVIGYRRLAGFTTRM